MPTNDTNSRSSAPAGRDDPAQLDLFAPAEPPARETPRGITADAARSAISPGWWQVVAPFFRRGWNTIVTKCSEVDGTLELETAREVNSALEISDESWARDAARSTCGCCGNGGAQAYKDFDRPTRIVCSHCREQLLAGEAYLAIADRYYTLAGERRIPPLPAPSSAASNGASTIRSQLRQCTTLQPTELRELVRSVNASMQSLIVGQDDAVRALALLGSLHVGGGLPHGARALIVGPSGAGKSSMIAALRAALADWDLAWVVVEAPTLSSPGWRGAWLGDSLAASLNGAAADSLRARRAVVVVDELHHIGVGGVGGPGSHIEGNMLAKRDEVMSAMLGIFGDATIPLGDMGASWASREALVIGAGVFPHALKAGRLPTTADLVAASLPIEVATRFEQIVRLERLPERALVQLLHRWPALHDLAAVCTRLGYTVRVSDEAVRHAARIVTLAGEEMTARTGGAWLVAALRRALTDALADPDRQELVITPDSLPIPPHATRERPDDPWNDAGGGNSTRYP